MYHKLAKKANYKKSNISEDVKHYCDVCWASDNHLTSLQIPGSTCRLERCLHTQPASGDQRRQIADMKKIRLTAKPEWTDKNIYFDQQVKKRLEIHRCKLKLEAMNQSCGELHNYSGSKGLVGLCCIIITDDFTFRKAQRGIVKSHRETKTGTIVGLQIPICFFQLRIPKQITCLCLRANKTLSKQRHEERGKTN